MNKALIIAAAAVPVYAVLDIYRFVFWRSRSRLSTLLLDKKGHAEDYYVRRDSAADRLREKMHVRYTISSDRGETLQGFYYPAGKKPGKKLVFIVHGYHSEHAETAGMFYDLYHSRGFDIFTCDNTASGESGGKLFGYNVFESADCLKWLNFLRSQFGEDIKVVLHGFSLGGATVLKMSDRCPGLREVYRLRQRLYRRSGDTALAARPALRADGGAEPHCRGLRPCRDGCAGKH